MKKTALNLVKTTGVLLSAVVVISCNQQQNKPAPASAQEVKKTEPIVFVNSDSLLNNYEFFKDIKAKFEAKSKKAQSDLTSKGTAFQKEVAEYQKNAQNMSADQRAATEERLARKQQELAAFNQNASAALQSEEAQEYEKLYNKVSDYLKTYAKNKGYKMVLTYSRGNPTVLYADSTLDVTKEVVAGLNEAYKKEKK